MKKIILPLILIIGVLAWKAYIYEPAPAKAYRGYRGAMMAARGFTEANSHNSRWEMSIESCDVDADGNGAVITALEKTAKLPPNAASFTFATITTRKIEVQMELLQGKWGVVEEEILEENVSTFSDRKYANQNDDSGDTD